MRAAQVMPETSFGWVWQPPAYPIFSPEYWQSWIGWVQTNHIPILLGVIILLLLLEQRVLRKQRTQERSWWRGRMEQLFGGMPRLTKKQKKAYLDQMSEDILVEGIEAAVYEGKLSREDAKGLYSRFALYAGLKGLLPRTDQDKLKRELQFKHAEKSEAKTELGGAFLKALNGHAKPTAA